MTSVSGRTRRPQLVMSEQVAHYVDFFNRELRLSPVNWQTIFRVRKGRELNIEIKRLSKWLGVIEDNQSRMSVYFASHEAELRGNDTKRNVLISMYQGHRRHKEDLIGLIKVLEQAIAEKGENTNG